jgi:hypothetical protein
VRRLPRLSLPPAERGVSHSFYRSFYREVQVLADGVLPEEGAAAPAFRVERNYAGKPYGIGIAYWRVYRPDLGLGQLSLTRVAPPAYLTDPVNSAYPADRPLIALTDHAASVAAGNGKSGAGDLTASVHECIGMLTVPDASCMLTVHGCYPGSFSLWRCSLWQNR